MKGRRNPLVATEGVPYTLVATVLLGVAIYQRHLEASLALAFVWLLVYLIFRDPIRKIPPSPLGVVSPVDGRVLSVETRTEGVLNGEAQCIRIRAHVLGAYTARSPSEGQVMDLRSADGAASGELPVNAMWVQTDEGDDVLLQFSGFRFGLVPKSLLQFGDRVGQGWRAAHLRLARVAEVQVGPAARVLVEPGQKVRAGSDLIAKLPSP
ncbi:MAG: hypothetical protein AAF351_05580 [Pseudomonadota bacterium]